MKSFCYIYCCHFPTVIKTAVLSQKWIDRSMDFNSPDTEICLLFVSFLKIIQFVIFPDWY